MLKDVIASLDFAAWAEVSLAIFAVTFVAVVIRTLLSDKRVTTQHAAIVLNDACDHDCEGR